MASSDALTKAEEIVTGLIEFRDNYEITEDAESIVRKGEELEQKLKNVLLELDELQLSIENKAAFIYLRGKAMNCISAKYDSKAVECLSKAVKLDPSIAEAWNELGECYWKNKDIDAAANCFKSALSKCENKVSLRNLSMVQRQLGTDFQSKVENIRQSVDTAKQSVKIDVTDGQSWFVLGNAYLSVFFFAGQSPNTLKQCMAAYSKAEQDKKQLRNPDLFYNRSVAYCYQEHFQEALNGYKRASQLDPTWNIPKDARNDLIRRLKMSSEMIENKGNLKKKKLDTMKHQMKDTDFGPLGSPSKTSVSLEKTFLKDLHAKENKNTVICGKVVAVIPVKDAVPFPFILMDQQGECIAVSVFNLAVGKGVIIGDSVAIPEPYVEVIEVNIDGEDVSFRSIRVDSPVVMVVNKRKVGSEKLAFSVLDVTNQSR